MIKQFKYIILVFILLPAITSQGQDLKADDYTSEFIWGINKNTAGGLIGGFVFRKSHRLNDRLFESYGLELMNVKHPLESQVRTVTGNTVIFGKTNYLYAIRLQYGRELVLFKKAPQQGVEIKLNTAIGPTIGLQAPYYVEVTQDGGLNTVREQYNPNKHIINCPPSSPNCIIGTGYIFQGIQESDLKIGANAKASLSFELGTSKNNVTGFEAGFLLDAYAGDITLIPTADNKNIYPTAFLTLFYGSRR